MSIDLPGAINVGATALIIGILVLGIYRALEMRRGFVRGAYRSRATWSTFLMVVIITSQVANYSPDSGILSLLGIVPFVALLVVIFAYADRSVLVAIDTDFFHRDTLAYHRVRWPAAIAFAASFIVVAGGGVILSPAQQSSVLGEILNDLFYVALVGILGYLTAALIVGARRSADRTLRRSILLLGLALSTLVFSIVVTNPLTPNSLPYVIVNQGTGIIGIYLIYRSVMSLSPLGRVEKNVVGTSLRVPQTATPA